MGKYAAIYGNRSLRSKMHPLQAEAGQKGEEKRRKKLKVKIIITIL